MNLLRLIPILAFVTCQQKCPVPQHNQICKKKCEDSMLQCIVSCPINAKTCVFTCVEVRTKCNNECPCELNCLDGCKNCDNPVCICGVKEANSDWNDCVDGNGSKLGRCIDACNNNDECEDRCVNEFKTRQSNCPCEKNCPDGCPCDNYACADKTSATASATNAVLVLSTWNAANKPMVIGWDGEYNDDLDFKYGDGTTVYNGCGATLMGQFWYFGGSGSANNRQVSKIVGCQLVRQNDIYMNFNFDRGSCNSFTQPKPKILLCFDYFNTKECHTFDGEYFKTAGSSEFSHVYTYGMGNYKNKALTTGCEGSYLCGDKTELMDMETLEWSNSTDYPFAPLIYYYSTAATDEAAYIIGGLQGGYRETLYSSTIAEFKNDKWRKLGDLIQGRQIHGSISIGHRTMVVGGATHSGDPVTEVWELVDKNSKVISPSLPRYAYYYGIAFYPVDSDFCRK